MFHNFSYIFIFFLRFFAERDKISKLIQMELTENRYFVRTMLVGKETAGKRSLLKRLLQEDISDVPSTDGVDIVVHRCKINIENGKWKIDKGIKTIFVHIMVSSTRCLCTLRHCEFTWKSSIDYKLLMVRYVCVYIRCGIR